MSSSRYVVVGAGLAGAATALALARGGHEVTVVERSVPAAPDGSSHGSARIFRYAYPDAFYARMALEAKSLWQNLEQASGRRLITPTGSLDFGTARDPAGLAAVLAEVGVEHELLTADEARSRWPGLAVDTAALWHPGAGVIDAEMSVNAMLELARAEGALVLTGWPVARAMARPGGYRLTSVTGEKLDAERVLVSAGGWLPELLAELPLPAAFLDSMPPLTVRQEQAFHFPYRQPGTDHAGWPTFIHKSAEIATYGLPGGRDAQHRGQKVAEYNGGRAMASAGEQDGRVSDANRRRVVDHVQRYLPGLVPEPYAETTCLFTNTPSEDFVIDGVGGITVVSPCSGHGAKFAPLIGQLAAEVATGSGSAPDRFRLQHGPARAEVAAGV